MNKVTCENGHYFNLDKFAHCPICGAKCADTDDSAKSKKENNPEIDIGDKTVAEIPADVPEAAITETKNHDNEPSNSSYIKKGLNKHSNDNDFKKSRLIQSVSETDSKRISVLPKTMSIYSSGDVNPPVGWIVGLEGNYVGTCFALKAGTNRVGRNPEMEICLIDDPTISRDANSLIIFDSLKREFYIQAGMNGGLTYLNGDLIFSNSHDILKPYDRIIFGKSEFVFVPLCGEHFTWDDFIH